MLILGSDELSVLTNEVVSGVESITKALSKLGEYLLLPVSTLHRLPRLPSLNMWLKVQLVPLLFKGSIALSTGKINRFQWHFFIG